MRVVVNADLEQALLKLIEGLMGLCPVGMIFGQKRGALKGPFSVDLPWI